MEGTCGADREQSDEMGWQTGSDRESLARGLQLSCGHQGTRDSVQGSDRLGPGCQTNHSGHPIRGGTGRNGGGWRLEARWEVGEHRASEPGLGENLNSASCQLCDLGKVSLKPQFLLF